MPTAAEVKAQLTGPGGMFEVVTEEVLGRPMQVYKSRMPSLRSVAEVGAMRGDDQTFLVYGDRTYGFTEFVHTANGVAHALRDRYGLQQGDRVAVLSQNNPEWCLTFWATVQQGAVLVGLNGWWTTDEIEYGLQDSGAKVLVADQKRFERIAGSLDLAPDLEHVFLIDCTPADVGLADDKRVHSFSELTGSPTADFSDADIAEDDAAVIFYTSGTTGRPKGAISTHRSMIANLQNTMYGAVAGGMVGGAALPDAGPAGQNVSLFTSPLFHVSGCHSTLVVGLLAGLKLVMPRGSVHPGDGARADPGAQGHRVGHRAHDGVARLRAPRSPRVRHVVGAVGGLRRLTVGGGAPADDPRDVPERQHHHERLRAHRDVVGGHRDRRSGRHRQARPPWDRRCPPCR